MFHRHKPYDRSLENLDRNRRMIRAQIQTRETEVRGLYEDLTTIDGEISVAEQKAAVLETEDANRATTV